MTIAGVDHIALPTSQPEAMISFYTELGFRPVGVEEWRRGDWSIFAMALGDFKINFRPEALWRNTAATLCGPTALPGCGDICFLWTGTIDEAVSMLDAREIAVIEGPVLREGGRQGGAHGTSVYFRDPEDNLLELITYERAESGNT